MKIILETGFTRFEKAKYERMEFDADSIFYEVSKLFRAIFTKESKGFGIVFKGINHKGFSSSVIVR